MMEQIKEAIAWIAVAVALGASTFFVTQCTQKQITEVSLRQQACVQAGGSWINSPQMCIR